MRRRILLVRHGRSSLEADRRLDAEELRLWFEEYDAAGIADDSHPPESLRTEARNAAIVVASDMERARASAERLAPGTSIRFSPLLREIHLPIPSFGSLRLPLQLWALVAGVGWAMRRLRRVKHAPESVEQGRAAAAWLDDVAAEHGAVLAMTHANVRNFIARALVERGWVREPGGSRLANWGVWTFVKQESLPHLTSQHTHRER